MPSTTSIISGEQRQAIYEFLLEHLSRIADLPLAIDCEDFATASRLTREFSQDLRLLGDVGWGTANMVAKPLTIPSDDLLETLQRLHADAEGALHGSPEEREAREAEEALRRRDQLVLDTASGLLVEFLTHGEERV
jgi:hypothetical protein